MSSKAGSLVGAIFVIILIVSTLIVTFILMLTPVILSGFMIYYGFKLYVYRTEILNGPEIAPSLFAMTDSESEQVAVNKLKQHKILALENKTRVKIDGFKLAGEKLNLSLNRDGRFSRRSKAGKVIQSKIDELQSILKQTNSEMTNLYKRIQILEDAHHYRLYEATNTWDKKEEVLNFYFEKFVRYFSSIVGWFIAIGICIRNNTIDSVQPIIDQYHAYISLINNSSGDMILLDSNTWVFVIAAVGALLCYFLSKYLVRNVDSVKILKLSDKKPTLSNR